ncbi:MAG: 1-phosphofructokinase family hexose kinase [Hyphomonadaceae bacterium]
MSAVLTITLNPAVDIYSSVPRLAPVQKLRCSTERRDPGGGGVNVARVIARLGGDVSALFVAGGPIGDYLKALVHKEVPQIHVVPIAGITRESFTVLEEVSRQEFRFVLPGPVLSYQEFEACLAAVSEAARPDYMVASGSLPPGAPADAYARLASLAKEQGIRFVLDASGDALRHALDEGVHLVKPNVGELQEALHTPLSCTDDIVDAARSVIDSGKAEIVVVTRGPEGAVMVTRDSAWAGEAIRAPVVSSVGAGDSFLAALVWSLARGDVGETALRYGLAAGAAALLQPGTTLCQKTDVLSLAQLVTTRRL